jgi:hypothetical protein
MMRPTGPDDRSVENLRGCFTDEADFVLDQRHHDLFKLIFPDSTSIVVAERARFELANEVRRLRHFQCELQKRLHVEARIPYNFNST